MQWQFQLAAAVCNVTLMVRLALWPKFGVARKMDINSLGKALTVAIGMMIGEAPRLHPVLKSRCKFVLGWDQHAAT